MYNPNITPHEHLSKAPAHYNKAEQAQKDRAFLIRELIREKKYTQSSIAKELGISRQAVSQLLRKYPEVKVDYHRAHWASDR